MEVVDGLPPNLQIEMARSKLLSDRAAPLHAYLSVVVNLKTVTWWNVSPGFSSVVGKPGWFGESG